MKYLSWLSYFFITVPLLVIFYYLSYANVAVEYSPELTRKILIYIVCLSVLLALFSGGLWKWVFKRKKGTGIFSFSLLFFLVGSSFAMTLRKDISFKEKFINIMGNFLETRTLPVLENSENLEEKKIF